MTKVTEAIVPTKSDRTYDIYAGAIVALVDGVWRNCYVAEGFCTIADWFGPNKHIGVYRISDLGRSKSITGQILAHSRYVLVGPEITDDTILGRIAFVRYGRVATGGDTPETRLVDGRVTTSRATLPSRTILMTRPSTLTSGARSVRPSARNAGRTPRSLIIS